MDYASLVRKIRACESEVAAQLLLEGWIHRFQYTVGLDIGQQHDQANVVVVCKHFQDASTSHVVFAEDLTASKGQFQVMPTTWIELTDNEIALIHANYPHPQGFAKAVLAKFKEKNT